MGWVRNLIRAAWRPRHHVPSPNAKCPICGNGVVVPSRYGGDNLMGRIVVRPTEAELSAACKDHGRLPFNDATLRYFQSDEGSERADSR